MRISCYPHTMRKFTIIFAFALLILPSPAWAWPGKVISIQDADTITVLTSDKQQVRIRLYGIDAPEGGQAFRRKATQFVKGLLADRPVVEVDTKDTDRYGQTVAVVILPDGTNLNEEVVRAGSPGCFQDIAWKRLCVLPGRSCSRMRWKPGAGCGRTRSRFRLGSGAGGEHDRYPKGCFHNDGDQ